MLRGEGVYWLVMYPEGFIGIFLGYIMKILGVIITGVLLW